MIAATIGVGSYAKMASYAAQAVARNTGLKTLVLDDAAFAQSQLADPMHLKFRIFDFVEDEDVLYFDADQVCLRSWDPIVLADARAVVAVRDRMEGAVRDDAQQWGIPPEEYFNAGMFIINRTSHRQWLQAAEEMAKSQRRLRFGDQTALNATRCRLGIPIKLINRMFNWVGFGNGSLCYRLPVAMAHSLTADKRTSMEFHEGRYQLPKGDRIVVDAKGAQRLAGRCFVYVADGEVIETIRFREDGTVLPAADPRAEGHWFMQDGRGGGEPTLSLASDTEILHSFEPGRDGVWNSVEPVGEAQLIPAEGSLPAFILTEQNARQKADQFLQSVPPFPQDECSGRGIVICGGGPRYFPGAWVCIRMLRELGCTLPIELWSLGRYEMDQAMASLVAPYGVRCIDGSEVRRQHPVRILNGWELKPFAILHSGFEEVLLLDADNTSAANPQPLFDAEEYQRTGAVFWPDFNRLTVDRSIWRICGVLYRDEPEFETGQILVNKRQCWKTLQLTMHLNAHSDFYYRHVHGDKETFHMAWRMLDQPYVMVPTPIHKLTGTMCQHDFAGQRIFQHRNGHKWQLNGPNVKVAAFEREELCLHFLAELRQRWDGVIRWQRNYADAEKLVAEEVAERRRFEYVRVGHDRRIIELLEDGQVGQGRADCEEQWFVQQDTSGRMSLVLVGQGLETCRMVQARDDPSPQARWTGRWLVHERMPVELRPV